MSRTHRSAIALLSTLALSLPALAQNAPPASSAPAQAASGPQPYVAPPWTYQTKQLTRNEVDRLLGEPKKLLIIDVRRPDELTKYGSFSVYLNVQAGDLPYALDLIPKERVLLLVSNRAHRAGAAGDLLTSKGYKVAGAIGSEDYREAGGNIIKVVPRAPSAAPALAASK
jgi:rhodanese-related sulfurtransferase